MKSVTFRSDLRNMRRYREMTAMTKPRSEPVQPSKRNAAYRARMRAQGLRQVQMWVPDMRRAEFLKEIQADVKAISRARFEEEEREVMRFIEAAIDWSDLSPTPSHTA